MTTSSQQAVAAWGVEDLEVVIARLPHFDPNDDGSTYTFPHHCLDGASMATYRRLLASGGAAPPVIPLRRDDTGVGGERWIRRGCGNSSWTAARS